MNDPEAEIRGTEQIECFVYLRVIYKDAEIYLCRECFLPFVPRPGQVLVFGGTGYEIREVEYVVDEPAYWITVLDWWHGSDCGCDQGSQCCTLTDDEELGFITDGWEVEEILRGRDRERLDLGWVFGGKAIRLRNVLIDPLFQTALDGIDGGLRSAGNTVIAVLVCMAVAAAIYWATS